MKKRSIKLCSDASILKHNRRITPPLEIQTKLANEFKDAQKHLKERSVLSSTWKRARPELCKEDLTTEKAGRVGIAHMQGIRPTMEDRHIAALFNVNVKGTSHEIPLYGIFDGHGGEGCASFLEGHLSGYLKEHLEAALEKTNSLKEEDAAIFNVLKLAFVDLGSAYRNYLRHYFGKGGSTANIAIIYKNHLWVANVGDTRAILALNGKAVALSEDAKPHMKKYRHGVEARRSKVIEVDGIARVGGNLATARAVGHSETRSGVNPRAKVTKYSLDQLPPGKNYLVIACDGLWDVASSVEVSETVNEVSHLPPEEIAAFLTRKAFQANSSDNVSVLVVPLK